MIRIRALVFIAALSGCTQSHDVLNDGVVGDSAQPIVVGCEEQMVQAEKIGSLPRDLSCTGLFTDKEYERIEESARSFTPGYRLWSDNSDKSRWIYLPEGEVIDSSNMGEWKFPVGTKFWKEFSRDGIKVETRLFQKVGERDWKRGTYVWKASQKAATLLTTGTTTEVNGAIHDIPSSRQCDQCHAGHDDKVLGFEAVSLGLPEADQEGLTLQKLVDEDLLSDPPESTEYEIGDDGTGLAAYPLGWLHINCGVTCHNANANAESRKTGMFLKLDATQLDGRPSNGFNTIELTVNQPAMTQQWIDRPRIVPGKPDESLLVELLETRVEGAGNKQMPPVATRIVDMDSADKVRAWISAMPATESTAN